MTEQLRWAVKATYRIDAGEQALYFMIDELHELDEIIESGPDFGTIIDIRIRYTLGGGDDAHLTFEESMKL